MVSIGLLVSIFLNAVCWRTFLVTFAISVSNVGSILIFIHQVEHDTAGRLLKDIYKFDFPANKGMNKRWTSVATHSPLSQKARRITAMEVFIFDTTRAVWRTVWPAHAFPPFKDEVEMSESCKVRLLT